MKITLPKAESPMIRILAEQLEEAIKNSRFTASIFWQSLPKAIITIKMVRLRKRKAFCGNHPNACVLGGVDKRHSFLEGGDWVEADDLINDVLDRNFSGSTAWSKPLEIKTRLFIRKGGLRRINYDSEAIVRDGRLLGHVWLGDDEGVYQDCRGKEAPVSLFPDGTPGIYTRTNYSVVG